ncbi:MAG: hypothetical protein L7U56_01750 [Acidimicrobiales bacterium]|nr:hypothetical protein [Acidimicrobiales bacterium]
MAASLHLLGLTIDQQAPSSSLTDDTAEAIHRRFALEHPGAGLLILNTCARLEFYVEAGDRHAERLHSVLAAFSTECPSVSTMSYELSSHEVVAHLLRVSSGLESPILGDTQILAQLRRAERRAREARALSGLLTEAIRLALATGRAARRETTISSGGADVGAAVARAIADRSLSSAPVVVLGAGDAAERTLAAFEHNARAIGIVNRTRFHAEDLAARFGATVLDVDALHEWPDAVFVLAAPSVPDTIQVHLEHARLVVDVVPGGASPHAHVGLGDLADWSDPERLAAIEPVTERCDAALAEWRAWSDRQPFERAVGSLYRDLEQLVSELEAGECAGPVRSIVRRWLHPHVAAMRDAVTSPSHHPELIEEPV